MMLRIYQIFVLFLFPLLLSSQILINNFDGAATNETINWTEVERDPSSLEIKDDSTDAHEGVAALYATTLIGSLNSWGSFAQIGYRMPEGGSPMDWTDSDELSLWINVYLEPNLPENFVFRVHLFDQPSSGDSEEQYLYEHADIVDAEQGWIELKIPLVERETDGTVLPNDEGFVLFPKGWGGGEYNDEVLNLDKLVGYSFALVTTGLDEDEIEVAFDNFTRNDCCSTIITDFDNHKNYCLSANFPNPFNPSTEIQYQIPYASHVQLTVFNLLGQKVHTLVNRTQIAGAYNITFHAGDLSSGIYFYRLQADDFVQINRMILLP
ncbi:T9SS type A sorting domain-containing protein [bacterium]